MPLRTWQRSCKPPGHLYILFDSTRCRMPHETHPSALKSRSRCIQGNPRIRDFPVICSFETRYWKSQWQEVQLWTCNNSRTPPEHFYILCYTTTYRSPRGTDPSALNSTARPITLHENPGGFHPPTRPNRVTIHAARPGRNNPSASIPPCGQGSVAEGTRCVRVICENAPINYAALKIAELQCTDE